MSTRRDLGRFDVAIVGSGFAGSILARCLAIRGLRVALVERSRHPRFALGESSTPLAALSLERLARRFDCPDLHAMAAWGRWRARLPELGRGRKRGFTFYRHHRGAEFSNGPGNDSRLLVAASPDDEVADLHWLRSDVDAALAERAQERGVRLFQGSTLEGVELVADGVRLAIARADGPARVDAGLVVDASGPAGAVARSLGARDRPRPIRSRLVYSHLEGLSTLAELAPSECFDNPPYEEEAAAVHHLLDEGWFYVLRFDGGVASVGLVVDEEAAAVEGDASAEGLLRAVVDRYPSLARALSRGLPVRPWRRIESIAHRLDRAAGERWFALPHTLCFVDPLFSTGIAWSLHAVERLVEVLSGAGDAERYEHDLERDADRLTDLILAARRAQSSFGAFVAVSWIYFAAASWLETRQRLEGEDDPELGFLGTGDPVLGPLPGLALERVERARAGGFEDRALEALRSWAAEAVSARDLIGWADADPRNLYPVSVDRLIARAHLLGHSAETLRPILPRLRGSE